MTSLPCSARFGIVPARSEVAMLMLLLACKNTTVSTVLDEVSVISVRRDYNNAHLVIFGDTQILVDAGLEGDAAELDADLRAAGADMRATDAVFITHGHADHAGGAGFFHATYGTPIIAGAGDQPLLASGTNDTLCPTDTTAELRLDASQKATYSPLVADHVS